MLPADCPIRIRIAFLPDQGNITLGALVRGAGASARSDTGFLDGIRSRHGLGRMPVRGLPHAEANVKRIADLDRAYLSALAAPGALAFIDIARLAVNAHIEITHIAGDRFHFTVAQELDIFVASNGHHLGCEYSSRTVECWKGLVELGHVPANARLPFNQIDLFARICQA